MKCQAFNVVIFLYNDEHCVHHLCKKMTTLNAWQTGYQKVKTDFCNNFFAVFGASGIMNRIVGSIVILWSCDWRPR